MILRHRNSVSRHHGDIPNPGPPLLGRPTVEGPPSRRPPDSLSAPAGIPTCVGWVARARLADCRA
jgi:hypothetical protein